MAPFLQGGMLDETVLDGSPRQNSGLKRNNFKNWVEARAPFVVSVPAVVYVASVASAVYDQVSQLVPVQQVDDIDEVHQLDPVHQVDHKDECSKISLQKSHHKVDQQGFNKKLHSHAIWGA